MSFLKYSQNDDIVKGNGRGELSFGRAREDGMPFRGASLPLKDEEYEDFTEVVRDADVGMYDIKDPKEYAILKDILDKAANSWYQIFDYDKKWGTRPDGSTTIYVYIAYAVPHRELAKGRAQAQLLPTPVPTLPPAS